MDQRDYTFNCDKTISINDIVTSGMFPSSNIMLHGKFDSLNSAKEDHLSDTISEDGILLQELSELTSIATTEDEFKNEEADTVELKVLLNSWNLQILYNHFKAQNITTEVLKLINDEYIQKLMIDFTIGTQVIFLNKLENWRRNNDHKKDISTASNIISSPALITSNIQNQHLNRIESPNNYIYSPTPRTPEQSCGITLSEIFRDSIKGTMLQNFFQKNNRFYDEQRNILINLICKYFNDNNLHMSIIMSHALEKEIIQLFPTEKIEFYRTGTRGKLYNRCSNLKSHFKPINLEVSALVETTMQKLVPEEDAKLCERALKFDNLSSEEFDRMWQACTKHRLNEIEKLSSTYEILQKWPYYKTASGFRLIDMDFCYLFEPKSSILDRWDIYGTKILNYLSVEGNVKDKSILTKLMQLKMHPSISEDGKNAVLLWALHGYLVPSQKTVKKESGKNICQKYTIKDSQDAFLFIGKSFQELEDHIQFISSNGTNIQPFILAVGDNITQLQEIFVYFDSIKFSFNTILRAVDICYKIFHLFNLQYPTAAINFYTFLQELFYQMPSKKPVKNSKIHVLLNEMDVRNEAL